MPVIHLLVKELWLRHTTDPKLNMLVGYAPIAAFNKNNIGRIQAVQEARRLANPRIVEGWKEEIIVKEGNYILNIYRETAMETYRIETVKAGREHRPSNIGGLKNGSKKKETT